MCRSTHTSLQQQDRGGGFASLWIHSGAEPLYGEGRWSVVEGLTSDSLFGMLCLKAGSDSAGVDRKLFHGEGPKPGSIIGSVV